jgi:hypothetical protein
MIKSTGRRLMKAIRQADVYGQPITLTYSEQTSFKTYLGGLGTLVLGTFTLVYFVFLLFELLSKNTVKYNSTTVVKDLTQHPVDLDIAKNGFRLSLGLTTQNYSLLEHEIRKYIEIKVEEVEYVHEQSGEYVSNRRKLEMEQCGDNYPYHDKEIVKRNNLHKYVWITTDDYQIAGDWYSNRSKVIEISVNRWNNSTYSTCASLQNIDWFIEENELDVVMLNHYFDLHNFEQPIQSFLTQKYIYDFVKDFTFSSMIFIRENNVELMDSFFQFQSYERKKFYSVSEERVNFYIYDDTFLTIKIVPDSQTVTHSRTVYSFFDMLAQIGGVYGVLSAIFFLVLRFYAEQMMYYWVLRKNYQFNSEEPNKLTVYTKGNKLNEEEYKERSLLHPSKITPFKKNEICNSSSSMNPKILQNSIDKNLIKVDEKEVVHFTPEQYNILGDEMKQRRRFDFSTCDFLYGTFWWIKRKYPWCRKNGTSVHDNHLLFEKGLKKFNVDLDLMTIITTVRRMKVLTELLFNDNQKLLEKYSKYHTIENINFDDIDQF